MPFTFAHPAITLPLIKYRKMFSATGLIIGSMIPDFESFIRLNVNKPYSHTWFGMFWFDLPLGIITAFLFHNIVRAPLIQNLPGFIGDRFIRFMGINWNLLFKKHYLKITISMFIGIFSHLLWDSFTHLNIANPGINASTITIFNTQLHAILQDFSSVAGLIIITWYIIRLPNNSTIEIPAGPEQKDKILYWMSMAVIAYSVWLAISTHFKRRRDIIFRIDIVITAILLGLVIASFLQKTIYKKKQPVL